MKILLLPVKTHKPRVYPEKDTDPFPQARFIFMKIEQIFIKTEMTNLWLSNFLTGGSFIEFEALYLSKTFIFEINVLRQSYKCLFH